MVKPQLSQEQKLTWKMTQKLSQAIEILQYNGVELEEYLEKQVEENPLLEWKKGELPSSGSAYPVSGVPEKEQDLYAYIKDQLLDIPMEEHIKRAVVYGIDSLNEHGYFDVDVQEWGKEIQANQETIEQAIQIIQSLEPAGIGAWSLQESISLQLQRLGCDANVIDLVHNNLQLVAEQDVEAIAEIYGCTKDEAQDAMELIQGCHPRPGLQVAPVEQDYIVPDAYIYKKEGTWEVELSIYNQPTIVIDESLVHLSEKNQEAQAFIHEKYKHAEWLQMAIEQRKKNVLSIIEEIVNKQESFFESGPMQVHALRLREIADEVNLHVSTVSRAIRNKYIQTPHGIYPIKFFFQQGVKMRTGQEASSYAIKQLIKESIQLEDARKPHSDQALSVRLKDEFGIYLSRRTVAKYRKELCIPSSTERKKKG
ncbi:RNA polymerase factor sigma-54 [Pontibacillus yanchengensis]|uniref:RNA polymerase factor sigma-54 n=1 Tax=Pontibacillus yanchengensis TaxID=462910 RepID=A0A6I4ZWW3_9BACI|nr:RNA polymerase factor sigma-54 [Pontibacillus yanchengensis]MYL33584.1 RNA polymerase factor sigma-54 [Pontibacillus yanchengensis]